MGQVATEQPCTVVAPDLPSHRDLARLRLSGLLIPHSKGVGWRFPALKCSGTCPSKAEISAISGQKAHKYAPAATTSLIRDTVVLLTNPGSCNEVDKGGTGTQNVANTLRGVGEDPVTTYGDSNRDQSDTRSRLVVGKATGQDPRAHLCRLRCMTLGSSTALCPRITQFCSA